LSQFSALREGAGFEILDIVEEFSADYQDVVNWESGSFPAPPSLLQELTARQILDSGSAFANTLFEGDCLKILPSIPDCSVNLVLCDLPYGTTQNKWDSAIDLDALWKEYRRILKPKGSVILTSQGIFTAKLILSNEAWFKYKIVWEKSKPTNFLNAKRQPLRKHEDICVFYPKPPTYNPQMRAGTPYDKGVRKNQLSGSYGDFNPAHVRSEGKRYPSDIVYFKTAESEKERTVWHPTQKPVELGRYLVRTFSNEGDIVLDNAFGSGSFLLSAALENRKFIGIERNEEVHLFKDMRIDYVQLAADRLKRVGMAPRVVKRQ
jgi:site-specific DNA-methyltransferase (adenine-specific)